MLNVLFTALGVGGATVLGALIGLLFKKESHKLNDALLAFAGGVMLCAAVVGLIIPSINEGDKLSIVITILGIIFGAVFISVIDRLVPHLHRLSGVDLEKHPDKTASINKILLFVIAIAIHNLPEGMAVGVVLASFQVNPNSMPITMAIALAIGIAIQNFPEGAIISMPLASCGMKKRKTFLLGVLSGIVEPIGAVITLLLASFIAPALPYLLSFAAGAMIYVVVEELIPEMSEGKHSHIGTIFFAIGFSVMMILDILLG